MGLEALLPSHQLAQNCKDSQFSQFMPSKISVSFNPIIGSC